jgi:hypothetical protein
MPERPNPSLSANLVLCFHIVTGALEPQGAMNPSISSLGRNSFINNRERNGRLKLVRAAAGLWMGALETRVDGACQRAGDLLVKPALLGHATLETAMTPPVPEASRSQAAVPQTRRHHPAISEELQQRVAIRAPHRSGSRPTWLRSRPVGRISDALGQAVLAGGAAQVACG